MEKRLSPEPARRGVESLSAALSADNAARLRTLAALLDAEGLTTAAAVQAALFPAVSAATANKGLERLVKAVNDKARERGFAFILRIDADKKRGGARQLWFEGEVEAPAPRREALASIPKGGMIEDARGVNLIETPNAVVLITFNENEFNAVRARFRDLGTSVKLSEEDAFLGGLDGASLIHVHSLAGQGQVNAANLTGRVIERYRPVAVIGVGIAMGLKDDQRIGDVMVSREVRDTEMVRINADGSETPRGRILAIDAALEKRFEALRLEEDKAVGGLKVRIGRIFCGNPLSDNKDNRAALKAFDPQAIGYEMESFGVAAAAREKGTPWALVKAISDWGDGSKEKDREARQVLAATSAAELVRKALAGGPPATPGGAGPPRGGPSRERIEARYRARDLLPDAEYQRDIRAARMSQRYDAPPADAANGVLVMKELHKWVEDGSAPPLFTLLGEYGMGKTVTCERFYEELRNEKAKDPTRREALLFNLKDLTLSGDRVPTLRATVEECMERGWIGYRPGELGLDYVLDKMATGAVVIFDGLDEVLVKLTQANGQTFTGGLLHIVADYRARSPEGASPRVLIACRTHYFRSLADQRSHFLLQDRGATQAEQYRALELLPFTLEQVRAYLERTLPDENVDRLIDLIRTVHNLEELSRRPYTLRLIRELMPDIQADRDAGKTVNGVALYRKMVARWLARDSGKHHIRPDDKQDLAAHLAAHMWRGRATDMPVRDLETWLHAWLRERPWLAARYARLDAEQLEEDLRTATFLVRQDGDDPAAGAFRFAHASLQEFFLADYLLGAARDNAPERWEMPVPSVETLDFLGQMLRIEPSGQALATIQSWRTAPRLAVNEVLLAYALRAREKGWPEISLRGIDLSGGHFYERTFAGLDLSGARFRGARLANARFLESRLDDADFAGARLARATFESCACRSTSYDEADLTATAFRRCNLTGATTKGASGSRTQFLLSEGGDFAARDLKKTLMSSVFLPAEPSVASIEWSVGHGASVTACAFSSDGDRILSASDDQTLRLWDAKTGDPLLTLKGHENRVTACAFSPDGAGILSASIDQTLRLWDAKTGHPIITLKGHEFGVNACAFSPDGARILSASYDRTLRLWDAKTGDPIFTLKGHKGAETRSEPAPSPPTAPKSSPQATIGPSASGTPKPETPSSSSRGTKRGTKTRSEPAPSPPTAPKSSPQATTKPSASGTPRPVTAS